MAKCAWPYCNNEATNWGKGRFCGHNCKNKAYVDARRKRLKELAIAYKGGKCIICGYSRCPASLDFHHIAEKSFGISTDGITRSWAKLKPELDKCVLLCSNCHGEVHAGMVELPLVAIIHDGTDLEPKAYNKRGKMKFYKTCPHCQQRYATTIQRRIHCSDSCRRLAARKAERPDKETLSSLRGKMSWCALGRHFGVSDNAVRKWAHSYGIL